MERKVLSEIYRIREMMGFVNEQTPGDLVGQRKVKKYRRRKKDLPYSWKNRDSGTLNFSVLDGKPLANYVGEEGFVVREYVYNSQVKKDSTEKITEPSEEITLEKFTLQGGDLPYADNMVKPYFEKYPGSEKVFDDILSMFITYIKNGGGSKLTNVTIQGSADSATPTLKVPQGYSSLDHPDPKPYNGETDPEKMNQYLADNRANEYAKVLIEKIKEATGFDLKINVLPGINYYGQPNRRGEEFRTIVLNPNAEVLVVNRQLPSDDEATKKSEVGALPKNQSVKVELFKEGRREFIDGYLVYDKRGNEGTFISYELAKSLNIPKLSGQMKASISEDKFYVGNNLVGTIEPKNQYAPDFNDVPRDFYWVGPMTTQNTRYGGDDAIEVHVVDGKQIKMIRLSKSYFVFYIPYDQPNYRAR